LGRDLWKEKHPYGRGEANVMKLDSHNLTFAHNLPQNTTSTVQGKHYKVENCRSFYKRNFGSKSISKDHCITLVIFSMHNVPNTRSSAMVKHFYLKDLSQYEWNQNHNTYMSQKISGKTMS
jgi:hypothetical protein